MTTKMKKLAIATAAALALGAGSLGIAHAFGSGTGGGGAFKMARMAERLELSDAQRDQIEDLMHESRKSVRSHIDGLFGARQKLRELRRGPIFDEAAIRAAAKEQAVHMEELIVARARTHAEVRGLLSPEQQVKMDEMGEWRRGHRGRRSHF